MKRSDIDTRMVLMACHISSNGGKLPPFNMLMRKYNAPWKVVLRAMERDMGKGYLDYGTSIRTAWLTEEGKMKLQEFAHQAANEKVDSLPLKKWSEKIDDDGRSGTGKSQEEAFRKFYEKNKGIRLISDLNKEYIEGRKIGNLPE